ncbi:trimeric intracellular cation channel family protein [Thauera sp.]|jgi:uncharacterized membrane protein YeiH|uniref:trimeric intracellular cation channel family protein n=1 Tax=Thauera sp. TaxID=1905334 RepID=UPI002A360D05|nr:trimeric intracellular cation channel family protein [Thauera sp.]MDX9885354.1 trimeric intracellular cation channel family protein [Thauera sp.]
MKFETILLVIEVGGTLAFAMSGLLEAIRKRMDIIGVFSVAFVSAFGGGTVRDVLLDRQPLFWIQNHEYVWMVIGLALTAPLWLKTSQHQLTEKAMEFADACGLGLFAISGASIATAAGMPPVVAILMGAITAVFGGVSRDVLCNQIPKVYHDHRPYTLCAVVGCVVLLAANALGFAPQVSMVAGICTATGSRLLAVAFGWKLPAWPSHKA